MGQALYRKYRSRSLDDVVGQDHITSTLKNAIKQNRLSHAYLFSGPRGIGKTSVARIFAYEVNNLDYKSDALPIDIIEIDAASNRRIDEIRELREKVYISPAEAKYKVYIIDEVHMLTREAFNALLKTLEEPPEHVIFILATTEIQRLPDTIISRTQRYNFKPASETDIIKLLQTICKKEKFDIDKDALDVIAKHSSGSYRDALSLLDQLTSHGGKISASDVEAVLGLPPYTSIIELTDEVLNGNSFKSVLTVLSGLYSLGFQAEIIAEQISDAIRTQVIESSRLDQTVLKLLGDLYEVSAAAAPDKSLELALLDFFSTKQPDDLPEERTKVSPEKLLEQISPAPATTDITEKEPKTLIKKPSAAAAKELGNESWLVILNELKKRSNTLYGVIRMAEPDYSESGKVKLAFEFPFHEKRLNDNANRQKLIDIIYEVTGQSVIVEGIIDKSAKPPKPTVPSGHKAAETESPDLTNISNIFGNAELLES